MTISKQINNQNRWLLLLTAITLLIITQALLLPALLPLKLEIIIFWILITTISIIIILKSLNRQLHVITRKKHDMKTILKYAFMGDIAYVIIIMILFSIIMLFITNQPSKQINQIAVENILNKRSWMVIAPIAILIPIAEELIWRELIPAIFNYHPLSFITTAFLFTCLHTPNNWNGWLMYGGLSLMLTILRYTTKDISINITAHILWNSLILALNIIIYAK